MGTHPIFESDFDCLTDVRMVTGNLPPTGSMKQQFAIHMPVNSGSRSSSTPSIWRRWKRLTTCQKRGVIVIIFLIVTSYAVGTRLHELHQRSVVGETHHAKHKKKHNKHHDVEPPIVDQIEEEDDEIEPVPDETEEEEDEDEDYPGEDYAKRVESVDRAELDETVEMAPPNDEPELESEQLQRNAWRGVSKGYKKYAWGHDMLKPISKSYEDWFTTKSDQMGLTLIDSLDVMVIMGLDEEFAEARKFVAEKMSLEPDRNQVNLFECTIRVLGGFLSTYHLTQDELFKEKAIEIGDRLLPAISASKTSVPYSDVNLRKKEAHSPKWGSSSSTSEVTTIQMEFSDLSKISNNPVYEDYVYRVSQHVSGLGDKLDGLVPMWISPDTGKFNTRAGNTITLGARTDSYYEYLFKRWYQEKTDKYVFMLDDFKVAMDGVRKHLMKRTAKSDMLIVGEKVGSSFKPKMDHLVCFLPGTLALAVHAGQLDNAWLKDAEDLAALCHEFYVNPTGLAPEISYFELNDASKPDLDIHVNDRFSILRPETVESYFYLWRITKNEKYRRWGWEFFESLQQVAKVADGYTSIGNVLSKERPQPRDKMESFFLGETLKYLYILFADDDFLPLDRWVFNTEAHPLPVAI